MAFPTTGILDNFNRADEGPPPSSSWDYPIDSSVANGIQVTTNTAGRVGFSFGASYWKTSFGPDSEVYGTLTTLPGTGIDCFFNVRIASPGTGGSGGTGADGYSCSFINQSGSDELIYWRVDNATYTQLGSTQTPGNLSVGDKLGLEMIGSVLQAYRDTGGGWATYGTSESSGTYTAGGYISVGFGDNTGRIDDVGGGTVVAGGGTNPKGPLSNPFAGPFGGPI